MHVVNRYFLLNYSVICNYTLYENVYNVFNVFNVYRRYPAMYKNFIKIKLKYMQ